MLMAVLFIFTACEVDDSTLKAPEKMEKSTDFSSMSISELDAYYLNMDRSQMNEKHSDLKIQKIKAGSPIKVRASCSLDIKIQLDAGTATLFYWYVDVANTGSPPTYSGVAAPGNWVNVTNS